jgi:hypothetical protein
MFLELPALFDFEDDCAELLLLEDDDCPELLLLEDDACPELPLSLLELDCEELELELEFDELLLEAFEFWPDCAELLEVELLPDWMARPMRGATARTAASADRLRAINAESMRWGAATAEPARARRGRMATLNNIVIA